MFISHFEVIDSKSGSVVFQTTLWDALGDTIAFSFAPPLDENHPDGSRAPPPPSISLGTAVIPRRNKKQRLRKMLRGWGGSQQSVIMLPWRLHGQPIQRNHSYLSYTSLLAQ